MIKVITYGTFDLLHEGHIRHFFCSYVRVAEWISFDFGEYCSNLWSSFCLYVGV